MRALEIGCGAVHPKDGWDYLDSRNLPNVTYVQSAADLGNIDTGIYDLVVARDVIEHLPWRQVPQALQEWVRVVKPGGHVEVETPNALELAEMILHPGNTALPRWGRESDWQRLSRTAYGHQDFPENFHGCYFTREWLTQLLIDAGACEVQTVHYNLSRMRLRGVK